MQAGEDLNNEVPAAHVDRGQQQRLLVHGGAGRAGAQGQVARGGGHAGRLVLQPARQAGSQAGRQAGRQATWEDGLKSVFDVELQLYSCTAALALQRGAG